VLHLTEKQNEQLKAMMLLPVLKQLFVHRRVGSDPYCKISFCDEIILKKCGLTEFSS
jgi:hypothetical protein